MTAPTSGAVNLRLNRESRNGVVSGFAMAEKLVISNIYSPSRYESSEAGALPWPYPGCRILPMAKWLFPGVGHCLDVGFWA